MAPMARAAILSSMQAGEVRWQNSLAMSLRRWLVAIAVCSLLTAPTTVGAGQQARTRAREAYSRAVELQAQGNHGGALALLWEAAGLSPDGADVQNGLGEALERMGALDAAVEAYRLALSARPDFRKAANNLILALVKAGKGEEAVRRARALVAAAPNDPDRYFTLGLAQSEQDVAEAIKTFRRALELAPRHTLARYNLALVLRRGDRLSEALDELQRTLAIDPRPEAHYTLGAVLKAKRDWTGAARSLRRAIALRPDLPAAHYTLAQVLQLIGDDDGARAHLAEAERLRERAEREQRARMSTVVGAQQLDAGDVAGAIEHFRRATAAFDAYAPAHYQLGLALRRLGRHDAARAAFARAHQLNPSLVPPQDPPL